MSFIEVFILAVGLSMDALAVSISKGLTMRKVNYWHAFLIAVFFGVFQAAMPLIGYLLAGNFSSIIDDIDGWIAFFLLCAVGGKMLWDGIHQTPEEAKEAETKPLSMTELTLLAVATSIDALVVGVAFAAMRVDIVTTIAIIGITTFVLSFIGVIVGNRFGARYERAATIAGGALLVMLGVKMLLSHLGILPF